MSRTVGLVVDLEQRDVRPQPGRAFGFDEEVLRDLWVTAAAAGVEDTEHAPEGCGETAAFRPADFVLAGFIVLLAVVALGLVVLASTPGLLPVPVEFRWSR